MVALLASRHNEKLKSSGRERALATTARFGDRRVVLAFPQTYMNDSGISVGALVRKYKVTDPSRVVIVHDELDLDFGVLKLKRGGGEGGHNGLRSVSTSLGTRDYLRVRVGIGRPPGRMDPADHVLRDFSAAERRELQFVVDRAADAVENLLAAGLVAAQNRFH